MKISDMDPEIREALVANGLSLDDRATPEEALVVWSGYKIGDTYWAAFVIEQLSIMRAHERIAPNRHPSVVRTFMVANDLTMCGDDEASYEWPDRHAPILAHVGSRTWVANDMSEWREI